MTLTAIISGIFAIAAAVPYVADALYAAIDGLIAKRVEAARQGRIQGYDFLKAAKTEEEMIEALKRIIRNRPN